MNKKIIKEACIDNFDNVNYYLNHINEIDRFETCSKLEEGGLTPSIDLFNYIKNNCDKTQVIMIRNKNSFLIEDQEDLAILKKQINDFLENGGKHFIFGYINKNNEIDENTCNELIEIIKKRNDTTWNFHMAIDETNDYDASFKTLIKLGFTRVLTKGGKKPAIENLENLKILNEKYGDEIEIIVGGKVTNDNYLSINKKTKINQFHGTRIA